MYRPELLQTFEFLINEINFGPDQKQFGMRESLKR